MEDNQKLSTSSDATRQNLTIASKDKKFVQPVPTHRYKSPNFVSMIIGMRNKLFELQKTSDEDEPTTDEGIIKMWKHSNKLIYGDINGEATKSHIALKRISTKDIEDWGTAPRDSAIGESCQDDMMCMPTKNRTAAIYG
ncbi:hypothetical protein ACROYT_G015022 [Oculina patagonica]